MVILVPESTTGEHETFRKNLEDLLKLMLIVWCKENSAIKSVTGKPNESDKSIKIERKEGEFGFRIHGSRPVVISAIEPETAAENSGLEVGDIILSLNGIDVLNKSHAEVVQIAQNSKVLILEVARTCDVLNPESAEVHGGQPLYCGYLWKLGGHASGLPSNKWVRRWFSLKSDHCLYYYKTDSDHQPVGATMLLNYDIYRVADKSSELPPRQFRFDIKKIGVPILHLAGDTEKAILRWIEVLKDAVEQLKMTDNWLQRARRNLLLSPGALVKPDCFGYLVKIGDEWKSFNRRYCVLKDACLYFYQDVNAGNAFGVACLHGYKVRQPPKDIDKHSFEIIPSDPNQKYFYFCTETDMDKKRWVTALETSIQRLINVD